MIEQTIKYLNESMPRARFYAIELVRFSQGELDAFEARTLVKPSLRERSRADRINEDDFLSQITNETYRTMLKRLLDEAAGLGYGSQPGSTGLSLKLKVPGHASPVSVLWLFPPGRSGWLGLRDVSLGIELSVYQSGFDALPHAAISRYVSHVRALPGVSPAPGKSAETIVMLPPERLEQAMDRIFELLTQLYAEVNDSADSHE